MFSRSILLFSNVFYLTFTILVPSKVVDDSLHGYATSSTTLNLSWSPGFGSFTGFILSPVCHDAYDAPLQINQTVAEHNFTKIIGLSPESYCSIDIQAIAGDQTGISTSFVLTNRTYTSGKSNIRIHHECEGGIKNSNPMIMVWHNKACLVMMNRHP